MKRTSLPHQFLPRLEPLEPRTVPSFLPGVQYVTGGSPGKPDVADFNGDRNLDVAVATCFLPRVRVLMGSGGGTLAPYKEYPTQGACPSSTETAVMNNDGISDIEAANYGSRFGGSVSVLLGVGDGTFKAPLVAHLPDDAVDLVVRDFNADGFQDVAAVNYTNHRVFVLLGNGDGTLSRRPAA